MSEASDVGPGGDRGLVPVPHEPAANMVRRRGWFPQGEMQKMLITGVSVGVGVTVAMFIFVYLWNRNQGPTEEEPAEGAQDRVIVPRTLRGTIDNVIQQLGNFVGRENCERLHNCRRSIERVLSFAHHFRDVSTLEYVASRLQAFRRSPAYDLLTELEDTAWNALLAGENPRSQLPLNRPAASPPVIEEIPT